MIFLRGTIAGNASGQSMIPILLTAAAIITSLIIATSSLTNGTRGAKTAQVSVENDMLATSIYQVINSEASCTRMIINGDGPGSLGIPYVIPSSGALSGVPPVYAFTNGMTFDGTTPFLVYSTASRQNSINSLIIPSPVGATNQGSLRLDPKGFINYGTQPAGASDFSSTACYLINLHVEAQAPVQTYGNRTKKFDFPLYVGVNTTTGKIAACQGATAGTPCVPINPVALVSPGPTCQPVGGTANLSWTLQNASYAVLQATTPPYGPVTVSGTSTGASVPLTPPAPGGTGPYVFTLTPYSTLNVAGSPSSISVGVEVPPAQLANQAIDSNADMSWTTGDSITQWVNIAPLPGTTQPPSNAGEIIGPPLPAPSQIFTFQPFNQCGDGGPITYATYLPSPSPSPSPSASASPSPTPSPSISIPPGCTTVSVCASPSPAVTSCISGGASCPCGTPPGDGTWNVMGAFIGGYTSQVTYTDTCGNAGACAASDHGSSADTHGGLVDPCSSYPTDPQGYSGCNAGAEHWPGDGALCGHTQNYAGTPGECISVWSYSNGSTPAQICTVSSPAPTCSNQIVCPSATPSPSPSSCLPDGTSDGTVVFDLFHDGTCAPATIPRDPTQCCSGLDYSDTASGSLACLSTNYICGNQPASPSPSPLPSAAPSTAPSSYTCNQICQTDYGITFHGSCLFEDATCFRSVGAAYDCTGSFVQCCCF